MTELPILMSAPMVLATLRDENPKTQTRRVVKPQPLWIAEPSIPFKTPDADPKGIIRCPYGQPSDRLYVKETFYAWGRWETRFSEEKGRDEWHFVDMTVESGKWYRYSASMAGDNGPRQRGGVTPQWWKRPAIFMPKVASRIQLDNVAVRVKRLQDISEMDAVAEGVRISSQARRSDGLYGIYECQMPDGKTHFNDSAYELYRQLWEQINGSDSWAANAWVWVVDFRRIK